MKKRGKKRFLNFKRLLLYGFTSVWLGGLIVKPFCCIYEFKPIEKSEINLSTNDQLFSLVLTLLWVVAGIAIVRMNTYFCKKETV